MVELTRAYKRDVLLLWNRHNDDRIALEEGVAELRSRVEGIERLISRATVVPGFIWDSLSIASCTVRRD